MYAWYECHYLTGSGTEDELLTELSTSRAVLLRCGSDPLGDVQGLDSRITVLLEKATLYLCCKGGCVLFCLEGAFSVAIDYYDAAWTRHLELEISIVWHCVESSKRGSSEQCMVAAAEGDDIED